MGINTHASLVRFPNSEIISSFGKLHRLFWQIFSFLFLGTIDNDRLHAMLILSVEILFKQSHRSIIECFTHTFLLLSFLLVAHIPHFRSVVLVLEKGSVVEGVTEVMKRNLSAGDSWPLWFGVIEGIVDPLASYFCQIELVHLGWCLLPSPRHYIY